MSTQPRYAEFIRLRTITEKWTAWENVDGNDTDDFSVNGGGADG